MSKTTHPLARVLGISLALGAMTIAPTSRAQSDPQSDAWKFNLGIGLNQRQDYPGSSDSKLSLRPVFGASYGRWGLGTVAGAATPFGVSYTLLDDGPWRVGVGLGIAFERDRSSGDSAIAAGLGEVGRTALGSVSARYNDGWFSARGNIVTDLGGNQQGTRASLDLEARYALMPRLMISAGPGITWADGAYTRTYFGVSAAQSEATGLAAYDAGAGTNSVRFNVGANYQLSPQWSVGGRITTSRLQGDAATSPITKQPSQTSSSLILNYRF